jgi:hypothetical protein
MPASAGTVPEEGSRSGLLLISKVVYDYCIYTRLQEKQVSVFLMFLPVVIILRLESKTLSMSTVGRFPPAQSTRMTYEGLGMSNV